ncbi:MAG: ribosome silencing factor [Lachnospiraceae bacterium]|nr:ribosome silencing factor [Lachnospiraceae bacterium]
MAEKDLSTGRKMAELAVHALEDKKAEDVRVIDISGISTLGDYFIIAGGSSSPQLSAMRDEVDERLGRAGFPVRSIEGDDHAKWILMDFGDIVVHLFDRESRLFYDLERIWRDGKEVDLTSKT